MARIFTENFEGTGYESTWTSLGSEGANNALSPDYAIPGTPPPNSGSQCLRLYKNDTTGTLGAYHDLGAAQTVLYFRTYAYISTFTGFSAGNDTPIVEFQNTLGTLNVFLDLYNNAGTLQLRLNYHDGGSWYSSAAANIATATWYCVEIKIDQSAYTYEMRLNGATVATGSVTLDRGNPRYIQIGTQYWDTSLRASLYFDLVAADNATWVGLETAASALVGSISATSAVSATLVAAPTTAISTIVTASGASALAIPRHKLAFDPTDATLATLYAVFPSSGSGSDVWRSGNYGNSWSAVANRSLDNHANLSVDSSGNLHIGRRVGSSGVAMYDRLVGSTWTHTTWDDYGYNSGAGTGGGTAHMLAHSSGLFAFIRSNFGDGSNADISWRRSTDSGTTFSVRSIVKSPNNAVWHRIGSAVINGQPVCVIWDTYASYCQIEIYRWNGTSFAAIANNNLQTNSTSQYCRMFSVIEAGDGTIHSVWWDDLGSSIYALRHAYRTYSGSWSTPATILTTGLDASGDTGFPVLTSKAGSPQVYLHYVINTTYRALMRRVWSGSAWSSATEISSSAAGNVGSVNTVNQIPATTTYAPVAWEQGTGISILTAAMFTVADMSLAAGVSGTAGVTASLTAQVRLAASLSGVSTIAGTLATSIPLAATVSGQTATSGALTISIRLIAAISGTAVAASTLTTAIPLGGGISAPAIVTGALTAQIKAAGAISGVSIASGNLLTAIPLVGSAAGTVTINGSITSGALLVGSTSGQSIITGSLTTQIRAVGAISSLSSATGDLATSILLAGVTVGTSAPTGNINLGALLVSNISGWSAGVGNMGTAIYLTGFLFSSATITATLDGEYFPSGFCDLARPRLFNSLASRRKV